MKKALYVGSILNPSLRMLAAVCAKAPAATEAPATAKKVALIIATRRIGRQV